MASSDFFEEAGAQAYVFIGGTGTQAYAHAENGGVCTKTWYDAQTDHAAAMAKLMGTNGGPIVNLSGCAFTYSNSRITANTNDFLGVEVGMGVWCEEYPSPNTDFDTGYYYIEAVDTTNYAWVKLSGNFEYDVDLDLRVGGAIDSFYNFQYWIDRDFDMDSCTVWINCDPGRVLAYYGGGRYENTYLNIYAFNTIPGDMQEGGEYYEDPVVRYRNGGPTVGTYRVIDCEHASAHGCYLSILANVRIEGFQIINLSHTKTYKAFHSYGADNVYIKNCLMDDNFCFWGCDSSTPGTNHNAIDCFIEVPAVEDNCILMWGEGRVMGCVIWYKGPGPWSAQGCCIHSVYNGTEVVGNIIVGGLAQLRPVLMDSHMLVHGNILIATEDVPSIVRTDEVGGMIFEYNIVIMPNGSTPIWSFVDAYGGSGSITKEHHNVYWEPGGNPLFISKADVSNEGLVMDPTSRIIDPMFIDYANGDFRLHRSSPCRTQGADGFMDKANGTGIWKHIARQR